MGNKKVKKKEFVVTGEKLITNIQPLNSWAVAHLFYGVPRWAKSWYRDVRNDNIVFTP